MKKILLVGVLSLVVITGCGKKQTITCTNEKKYPLYQVNTSLKIKLEGNQFSSMDMTMDAILSDTVLSKKEEFNKKFEEEYAKFATKFGVDPKVSEIDKGTRIELNMTAQQAKEFSGSKNTKTSKKEVIETFEKQGFTCK